MMRDDTNITRKVNEGKQVREYLELPRYPKFKSKEMREAFDSQFTLRLLYKPKEGALWGFN